MGLNGRTKMKIGKLINEMHAGEAVDWLIENELKFAIVPRELTKDMRIAFHKSMEYHENCNEAKGYPDDQWDAMIEEYEAEK